MYSINYRYIIENNLFYSIPFRDGNLTETQGTTMMHMCGSIHTNHYHQRLHYVTLYNHPYAKQFFALLLHCLHHNSLRNEQYTIKHYITFLLYSNPTSRQWKKIRKKNKTVFLYFFEILSLETCSNDPCDSTNKTTLKTKL